MDKKSLSEQVLYADQYAHLLLPVKSSRQMLNVGQVQKRVAEHHSVAERHPLS